MKKFYLFILFVLWLMPAISFAADISFATDKNIFATNEDFLVQVFLDTKDTTINAVAGTVVFLPNFLELKEIRDGNSSINFWIEKPHMIKDGQIAFSGITTGGFSGPKKLLFEMVLEAKKIGSGSISFDNMQVLQNDGLGTKIPVKENQFSFTISKEGNGSLSEDLTVKDTRPPENFIPFVARDLTLFEGKYFLAFSATDKGSGIDHYEVRESPWFLFGIWGGEYIKTESPYLLKDQTLKSKIYVIAVDKNGNEKTEELTAQNKFVPFLQGLIIVIILILCILILKKVWLKRTRQ
jgi:hypothetical protein